MSAYKIKVVAIVLIITFIMLFSSGCWDSLDIDQKALVITVILDCDEEEIILYVEISSSEKSSSEEGESGAEDFIVVKAVGNDLVEARNNLDEKMNKPIYLSAVRAVVMTERFVQKHFIEYLHRFRADPDYRKKIDTVITREDIEELLKITKDKNKSLGFITEEIIETLDELGKSFKSTTMKLLENISSEYTGMLLPCIGISEEEIALIGYTIVQDNKINGFLPAEELPKIDLLKADKPIVNYRDEYQDTHFTIKVIQKKRSIKPNYDNNKISMDVNMEYKAEILYSDKKEPYDIQLEDEKALGELIKERLTEDVSHTITRSQAEFNVDYYHIHDEFRIKYPIEFDNMNWKEEYPKIKFNYNIKVKLGTTWTMDYSIDETK